MPIANVNLQLTDSTTFMFSLLLIFNLNVNLSRLIKPNVTGRIMEQSL